MNHFDCHAWSVHVFCMFFFASSIRLRYSRSLHMAVGYKRGLQFGVSFESFKRADKSDMATSHLDWPAGGSRHSINLS